MKRFTVALLFLVAICFTTQVHADIFGPRKVQNLKATSMSSYDAAYVDPGTILSELAKITQYLGVREGVFYDFNEGEFVNYAAATIYTYQPYGISLSAGALNVDGFATTVDWNAGAFIPVQDVPLLNLFQYLYIGGGIGARSIDSQWQAAYGLDAQFKFTF